MIGAGPGPEDAESGPPPVLIGTVGPFRQTFQGVLADKILIKRFFQDSHSLHGPIQNIHGMGKDVTENTRRPDGQINTRAAEFFQGDYIETIDQTVGRPTQCDPQEGHHLGQSFAVGRDQVVAHPEQGDVFRIAPFIGQMLIQKSLGQTIHLATLAAR